MGRKSSIAAGVAAFLILLLAVGTALAGTYTSPSKVTTLGPNTLTWSGQGVKDGAVDEQCANVDNPPGYLLWVFTTDGGSAADPVLYVNGVAYPVSSQQGGNYHFFTPYVAPADITSASVDFNALTLGNGDWILTISHGCPGGGHGQGAALDVTKTAAGDATQTFTWDVAKTVDNTKLYTAGGADATFNYTVTVTHDSGTVSGVTVTGEIDVFNPNAANVTGVDIVDTLPGGICTVIGGSGATVAPGDTFFAYSCTLAALPSGAISNTATISWPEQALGSDTLVAGSADFIIPVAFTTTKVDDCVTVTDSLYGDLGTVCATDASPKTFEYAMKFGDPAGTCTSHENIATITTNTTKTEATDSQTVEDCQGADLTVTKTAIPSFDLAYKWSITKDVDKTLVKQVGGYATFTYTVKVGHNAGTESNWKVGGSIKVENPNDWEDVVVDVSDTLPDASCIVTGGTDVTVPKSGSATVDYSCAFTGNPGSGTNTATVTWDADAAHTPTGTASGTAGFAFGDPTNLIDECVDVTDSFHGALGTVCVGAANPTTFTSYSRTVPVPANGCQSYDNTATFTANDTGATGSAKQTVTVCGPVKTGALTMGFWQNKNGQAIIKAGATTGVVCNSGAWLRQYAPFQDLSTSATCAQVATYVTNIIKAANASGATMNAMLKAQMLATSLDVYFSDPALGGNQIGAPAPIGGVTIDLTKICKTIGSCSSFENVSSAFGGSTSMTVSQMLTYAAGQSNVGGTIWYGQSKAIQGLAKDAFDAINNGVAFAP